MDQRPIGGSATGSCTSFFKRKGNMLSFNEKRNSNILTKNEVVYRHLFLWNHYCITR